MSQKKYLPLLKFLAIITLLFASESSHATDIFDTEPNKVTGVDTVCATLETINKSSSSLKDSEGKAVDLEKACADAYMRDPRVVRMCTWKKLSSEDSQGDKYCKAYKLAYKSGHSTLWVAALDAAAAATCGFDYAMKKKQLEVSDNFQKQAVSASSLCFSVPNVATSDATNVFRDLAKMKAIELNDKYYSEMPTMAQVNRQKIESQFSSIQATINLSFNSARTKSNSVTVDPTGTQVPATQACVQYINLLKQASEAYAAAAKPGLCGLSAISAGLGEAVGAFDLYKAGKLKVEDGQVKSRDTGFAISALKTLTSVGATFEGIRLGYCYQHNSENCKNFGPKDNTTQKARRDMRQGSGSTRIEKELDKNDYDEAVSAGNSSIAFNSGAAYRLRDIAYEARNVFVAMAAIRAASYMQAKKTKDETAAVINSLTSDAITAGRGGMSTGPAISASGYSSVTSTMGSDGIDRSASIADGLLEANLLPRNSPLGSKANQILAGLSDSQLHNAARSGSGGLMSAVSAAAGIGGDELASLGKKMDQIAMANLPGADQGKYAGGGGGSLGGGKSSGESSNLNLGALFGQPKEENSGDPSGQLGFRGPASNTDIWHADSDQNLFQIVSGKYEAVNQRLDR